MTTTSTCETSSLTRVEVRRPEAGGRCEVLLGCSGPADRPLVRPMLLSSDEDGARVSLVPEGALLLAGDAVRIEVVVGPGAHLELVEPAGTVAYAMDGGRARWDVDITLDAASSLVWAGEPFVVAEGARVDRRTRVRLGWDARLALREVLVLGRHGERPGVLAQDLTVLGPRDIPVLLESLHVGPGSGPLLLGARVMGTVTVVGDRLPPTTAGTRLELEGCGTMVRHLADEAHLAVPHEAWAQARQLVRAICSSTRNCIPSALAR
ncbi:urease accessory protein UreD [Aeromicrobium duanguangcaii]|uniref:urease accessory protein UreD n=1 Tax=Aeromicrobium duanguangcaii TaxID=2968086 RepID=UPI002016C3B0|nr:urease accessory protein UreD [Aeromicrobium duanguangcaii]MCL3839092.1 urease accessory protein UreD [Aeromicrobium duanguangcaii]